MLWQPNAGWLTEMDNGSVADALYEPTREAAMAALAKVAVAQAEVAGHR